MRRLSRLSDSIAQLSISSTTSPNLSHYICQRCLRRTFANPTTVLSSPYSTLREKAGQFVNAAGETLGLVPKSSDKEAPVVEYEQQGRPEMKLATTWEGLKWHGTNKWYEDFNRPKEIFEGFGPISAPLKDKDQIRDELLKAVVEVHTIRAFDAEFLDGIFDRPWIETDYDWPSGIRVGSDPETKLPVVEFPTPEAQKQILNRFIEEVEDSEASLPLPGEYEAQEDAPAIQTRERSVGESQESEFGDLQDQSFGKWPSISLNDLKLKFAIAKRIQQRTGIRLTDPQIAYAKTLEALFLHLWKPAPPKKLAERLKMNEELVNLPNVKIFSTRRTFVHKEKEVGRWKVIEDELNARGIPPTGAPF